MSCMRHATKSVDDLFGRAPKYCSGRRDNNSRKNKIISI
jgi:hypothetical protein